MKGVLYFDGASVPTNPGPSGAGAVLYITARPEELPAPRRSFQGGESIEITHTGPGTARIQASQAIGHATNNEAEWKALALGLRLAQEAGIKELEVYGDSQLVIKGASGEWNVSAGNLVPIYWEAMRNTEGIPLISWNWIRRELNEEADAMSLRGARASIMLAPH